MNSFRGLQMWFTPVSVGKVIDRVDFSTLWQTVHDRLKRIVATALPDCSWELRLMQMPKQIVPYQKTEIRFGSVGWHGRAAVSAVRVLHCAAGR